MSFFDNGKTVKVNYRKSLKEAVVIRRKVNVFKVRLIHSDKTIEVEYVQSLTGKRIEYASKDMKDTSKYIKFLTYLGKDDSDLVKFFNALCTQLDSGNSATVKTTIYFFAEKRGLLDKTDNRKFDKEKLQEFVDEVNKNAKTK